MDLVLQLFPAILIEAYDIVLTYLTFYQIKCHCILLADLYSLVQKFGQP